MMDPVKKSFRDERFFRPLGVFFLFRLIFRNNRDEFGTVQVLGSNLRLLSFLIFFISACVPKAQLNVALILALQYLYTFFDVPMTTAVLILRDSRVLLRLCVRFEASRTLGLATGACIYRECVGPHKSRLLYKY